MTDLPLSPLTEERFDEAWTALEEAFGEGVHPADREVERAMVDDLSRFLVATDAGRVVGTAGSFGVRMGLPGALVPVAGVTWVGVLPTHRRRGLLTRMMTRLLAERHEAGETVAALWASEAAIYQRFGYGPASWQLSVEVPRGAPFTRPVPTGGLELVAPTAQVLRPVFERVAAVVPGYLERPASWWASLLQDPEHRRSGASPLRCVVTDDGSDGSDGYALYATATAWTPTGPKGVVRVRELAAATPEAHARLWRYLLDHDLTATVEARVPVDDPLLQLLAEPRTAAGRLRDGLWVRPIEVGGALSARRYATDVDTVLEVTDPTCPWNARRWRLSGSPDGATCTPTQDAAELALDASDLGAALLGGTALRARAAAGRVTELRTGALDAVSRAFAPLGAQPFAPQVF